MTPVDRCFGRQRLEPRADGHGFSLARNIETENSLREGLSMLEGPSSLQSWGTLEHNVYIRN